MSTGKAPMLYRLSVSIVAAVALLATLPAAPVAATGHLTVAFLAGGQWDAALYQGPCGEVGLIDAGDGSRDEVLSKLDGWDARSQLRWINVSHYDADHVGDVGDVATATGVDVEVVYDRGGDRDAKDSATYRDYYDWVAPIRQPVDIGATWTLCSGDHTVTFTVVSAGTDGTAAGGVAVSEENDAGVCVKVEYRHFDLASCGDVNGVDDGSRADVESAVAPAYGDVEVAKVNQHGSAYSSNATYVDTLKAQVAVVMVGENSYGHPDADVLARWDAYGDVYRTMYADGSRFHGDVTVVTGADTFTVRTATGGTGEVYGYDETGGTAPPSGAQARSTDDSCPTNRVPEDGFDDTAGSAHEAAIDCVVWWKVANGKTSEIYNPSGPVSRAQMASFIARLILQGGGELPEPTRDHFSDDDGNSHEPNINLLAEAGIVDGTAPDRYAPSEPVSRAQMASFLVRTSEHVTDAPLEASKDWFADDDGNTHEPNINKAAEAGFTGGTASGGYEPGGVVSRAQMASFLARVLDLLVEAGYASPPDASAETTLVIVAVVADPDGDDVAADAGEYVEVRNDGTRDVAMNGWSLTDEDGHRLDWCAMSVAPGTTVRLYTGPGEDGPDHCHAGRDSAVWDNTGDTAQLHAPDGATVHAYTY